MSDRLRELTAFVRAGETGRFSRVARELGVSQPSISRMVASVEARLGVKLLLRTTRHVAPTDSGRVFLERARQILGDLDDAENAARGADGLRGTLRLALSGAFGIREVIPRLPGFATQHPKLGIELLMSDRAGANDQPIKTIGMAQVSTILMRSFMEQGARFENYDGRTKAWKHCKPPEDVANLILDRAGHWPFPLVRGVLAAPSLRPDGSIIEAAGYDAATGMYLIDPPPMPDIPERPTRREGEQALELLDDLLRGFPWQGDDDARAVGLSALITPVVRPAMPYTPMHAVSAPEAGSGKGYLVQLAAAIATGFPCPVISTGKDEEETEKRLDASLLAGHALLSIDNVSRPLGGDCLCQLLEQPLKKVRILGKSDGPLIEPRITLFATGNNLTLVKDVVRRTVTAYMDAGVEKPWLRRRWIAST